MINSISYIFGITTGSFKWTSIADLLILLLSVVILISILRPKEKPNRQPKESMLPWKIFFGVVAVGVLLAYVAVDDGGASAGRYLFLSIYITALILSLYSNVLANVARQAVIVLIALAILSNMSASINAYRLASSIE